MTPSSYEELVAQIASDIRQSAPELGVAPIGIGRPNKIVGASGFAHQIDVSLQTPTTLVLIECKCWQRKVGVAEVMVLAGRGRDISVVHKRETHLLLVSKFGATPNASLLAKHFGIRIENVESARRFGLQIGKRALHSTASGFTTTDRVAATVTRNGISVD